MGPDWVGPWALLDLGCGWQRMQTINYKLAVAPSRKRPDDIVYAGLCVRAMHDLHLYFSSPFCTAIFM